MNPDSSVISIVLVYPVNTIIGGIYLSPLLKVLLSPLLRSLLKVVLFSSIPLDVPHLTNEHRTHQCIAS